MRVISRIDRSSVEEEGEAKPDSQKAILSGLRRHESTEDLGEPHELSSQK